MKRTLILLSLVAVLSGFAFSMKHPATVQRTTIANADIDGWQAYAKKIFACIQQNDFKCYSSYLVNRVALEVTFKKISELRKEPLEKMDFDKEMSKIFEKTKKAFERTHEEGEALGIDWKKTVFKKVSYQINNEMGLDLANIRITFTYHSAEYSINLGAFLKINNKWVTGEGPRLLADPPGMFDENLMADSSVAMPDTVMVDTTVRIDSLRH